MFEEILLRLKEQLNVASDKEIGGLLGLSPTGFNSRKRRNAFPVDRLYELANDRPEVDVFYVLTGVKPSPSEKPSALLALAVTLELEPIGEGPLMQKLKESYANNDEIEAARSDDLQDINRLLLSLSDEDFQFAKQSIVRIYKAALV